MTIYIFMGPTVALEDARTVLDAVYLPPASQGDVYRAAVNRPQAIGIIDGYFDSVPAVWHKEILWALAQGVPVFGSASMGALRAAELAAFGMQGVGRVFESYRAGLIEDDDEVAIVHGPAEIGYLPLSEAMVNIRFTLASAEAGQVIAPHTRAILESTAKSMFYPSRSFSRLLGDRAVQSDGPRGYNEQLDALRTWLPKGYINQKREDALEMLSTIRKQISLGALSPGPHFIFEHTIFWEDAISAR
jgi:hypothetical protein